MRTMGTFAVGLALVSGTALAQAQTVTRQITTEPVETVVTQGPNGTAVTRRILTPEPGVSPYGAPPLEYRPLAVQTLEPQYVEPAPALAPRHVVAPAPERRTTTVRRATTAARPVTTRSTRTVTRTIAPPPLSDEALVLSPAQRQVIYRTVVQREVYPAPVAQTGVYAPPAVGYPPRTIYPADDDYYRAPADRDYVYDDGYRAAPYRDAGYRDPYHPEYRQVGVPLVVGARIPQSVPLVAVPEPVVARIPAARPYSYARYGDRVYLVDPATGTIVADVTP
jgi:Protein of unknown function (DUF1236)